MQNFEKEFNEHIRKIKNSKKIVVVEGKKDNLALVRLGIRNVIELSKKPLFEVIGHIAEKNKDCIILTDLDKKGR